MERFQDDHRVKYGKFEAIEWNDLTEVKKMREQLQFGAPMEVSWSWDYVGQVEELRRLYEISKNRQWNAEKDLNWNESFDKSAQWGQMQDVSPISQAIKMMGGSEAKQREATWDNFAYVCSQLLHGEQAALEICGQLCAVCPDMDMKFFAGSQVFDEVRHIEAFSKFITRKLGTIWPIDPNIKFLLQEILKADTWQKKTLGMQTLFEGMALGIMNMMDTYSDVPLFKEMIKRVKLDESRHAAFGVISMQETMRSADPEMKADLEDWAYKILECLNAGQYYGVFSALGPKYGIDARNFAQMLYGMPDAVQQKSLLYTHATLPHLKKLGLITERTADKYRAIGLYKALGELPTSSKATEGAFDDTPVYPATN
ncbi:MAG: ferritin-like domain-containing protein [Bdellovibrionota bacterium]